MRSRLVSYGSLPMGTWSASAKFLLTSDGKDRGATSRLVFLEHRRNHNPRCTRHASWTSLRVVVLSFPSEPHRCAGFKLTHYPVASLTIRAAAWRSAPGRTRLFSYADNCKGTAGASVVPGRI